MLVLILGYTVYGPQSTHLRWFGVILKFSIRKTISWNEGKNIRKFLIFDVDVSNFHLVMEIRK